MPDRRATRALVREMDLTADLDRIIREQFDKSGVSYNKKLQVVDLAASYFEMLNRRIDPRPRRVHFSEELCESLGRLIGETDPNQKRKAADAWSAVFKIRYLMVRGRNVNAFLHKGIESATGKRSRDGMLWDFGMHHFHLSTESASSGFVERSDYLLFAVLTDEDAYFVDVGPHPTPKNLGWVRQELLRIVRANWPELIKPWILHGTKGDVFTDRERARLRDKRANVATDLDGHAVAPLGGGLTAAGSSILCRRLADELMHQIECHQEYFDTPPPELRLALQNRGMATAGKMEFDLVLLEELGLSEQDLDSLGEEHCFSRRLCELGFAVVERTTRRPIVVTCILQE